MGDNNQDAERHESMDDDAGLQGTSSTAIEVLGEIHDENTDPKKTRTRTKKNSNSEDDARLKTQTNKEENKLRLQTSKLQAEVKTLKKNNEKYRKEMAELNAKCASLVIENRRLTEANAGNEIDGLQQRHQAEVLNLNKMLESSKQELADIVTENEQEMDTLRLQNTLEQDALKQENKRLISESEGLKQDYERFRKTSEEEKLKLKKEIGNLNAKSNFQDLTPQIRSLESQNKELKAELSELQQMNRNVQRLLDQSENEKHELLEQLDSGDCSAKNSIKPKGLVIFDKVTEKIATKIDAGFEWSRHCTTLSDVDESRILEDLETADTVLFLLGSVDIRSGMTGLNAFFKLKTLVEIAQEQQATVVLAETPPTHKRGAAGHATFYNYKLTKMENVEFVASNPKVVKEDILENNDELRDQAAVTISRAINNKLVPPRNLKIQATSAASNKAGTGAINSSRRINELIELKSIQVGRVIGIRGTTITSLSKKHGVVMRIGKWAEPKKENRDELEMKMDGVIISGTVQNVNEAVDDVKRILEKSLSQN